MQKQILKSLQIFIILTFVLGLLGPVSVPVGARTAKAHPLLYQVAADNPAQTVSVIVQKLSQGYELEAQVSRLGGKVTKDLHFIKAFAAEMTARAAFELARDPRVRWVSLDAPVVSSSMLTQSVRDEFNTISFSNNDGSDTWDGDWIELGESDGPNAGKIYVSQGYWCLSGACLAIGGYYWSNITDKGAMRQVDLSGAASAFLNFSYKRKIWHYGGDVEVQVSGDGGTNWVTLATYPFNSNDYSYISQSFDITTYISSNTQIRFLGSGNGVRAYLEIDNLEISYQRPQTPNYFLATTGADLLHTQGLNGQGITVAVIDSGIASHNDINGRVTDPAPFGTDDLYGHGTHVSGIIGGDGTAFNKAYPGMAPGVNLINLNVSDAYGMAYESDVVDAVQWIFDNKDLYDIRVVNMSLNSVVEDSYHNSPLNAAVEILWFDQVVVVVSAGNKGPAGGHNTARTAPANDPFVIAVGASHEHETSDFSDDTIAAFSSFGVTVDGILKPDIIAPGFNIVSALSPSSSWVVDHPDKVVENEYIRLSGTSMAAPVVSGAVALLLQDEPSLTPDQVKYRLLNSTSRNLTDDEGNTFPYLDAYAAVHNSSNEVTNTGIDASQLLWTGEDPLTWDSVAWNSVAWNSVAWNSVAWNSVAWNSVKLDGIFWGPGGGKNK